jgi:hypothetical protein
MSARRFAAAIATVYLIFFAVVLTSCGADKQKALRGAFVAVNATRVEFHKVDRDRQIKIATTSPTTEVDAALAAHRKKRDHVVEAFTAAYAAIAAAAVSGDGTQAALNAATDVYQVFRRWKEGTP